MKINILKFFLLFGMPSYTLGPPPRYETTFGPPPPFPFLEGVGYAGVQEFHRIFQNTDLSGFQWNGLLQDWARRNNVTDSFRLFKENLEREKRKGEANLVKCLDELRQFFIEYHRIGNNMVYTWEQANELRQKLFRKLTRKQKRLAVRLSNIFTPGDVQWPPQEEDRYMAEPYPPPFGPRRGRGRRWRKEPFGRRRMGPYPFHPMDFGQRPYGDEEEDTD
ncbi:hypothetical protein Aduo_013790 [Ancylostoma duodenale]